MSPEEYITSRVDDQINYYDRQSLRSRKWQQSLTAVQIVAGGLVPIVAGFSTQIPYADWLMALLGLSVTCATAFLSLNKYQERSINFRLTCESMKHLKNFFLARVTPYKGEEAFEQFVMDIEGLISKETSDWAAYARKEKGKSSSAIEGE